MKRADLEHILRASKGVTGETEFIVLGHDLAFSKLAARREKDLTFVAALLKFKMIRPAQLQELVDAVADVDLRGRLNEAWTICRQR